MAFFVASSDASGNMIAGSEEQLIFAPVEVDYPQTPAGSLRETSGGSVIKQQPVKDPRRRAWVWDLMPNYSNQPRYIRLIHRLEALLSTTRRTRNLSPWVFLKDTDSDAFRVWRFTSGTATAVGATSLTDSSKSLTTNIAANGVIEIVSGTGAGQRRTITANTATVFTVDPAWGTNPTGATYNAQYGEAVYLRCRVLSVSKRPTARAGISFEGVRMEFVVDDPNHNVLD